MSFNLEQEVVTITALENWQRLTVLEGAIILRALRRAYEQGLEDGKSGVIVLVHEQLARKVDV